MKKVILITLVFLPLLLISCSSDDDETPPNPFQGTWSGVYIGSDNGTWTANIDSKGAITGEISSYINTMSLPIQGRVNNEGVFDATISTSEGNIFVGQLTESTASGNWENTTGGTGTWEGTKQ